METLPSGIKKYEANDNATVENFNANADLLDEKITEIDEHVSAADAHGATSAATADRIALRDANGRFKVAEPSAADDVATKGYADEKLPKTGGTMTGPLRVETTGREISAGTWADISANNTGYALFAQNCYTAHNNEYRYANNHGSLGARGIRFDHANQRMEYFDTGAVATIADQVFTPVWISMKPASSATANTILLRDPSGRGKVAAPSAADDIARKDTVDNAVGNLTTLQTVAKNNAVAAINELFTSASNGKSVVAAAITGMGQAAAGSDTFAQLASKVSAISTDANAGVGEVLAGKTFYQGGVKRTGSMPNRYGDHHVTQIDGGTYSSHDPHFPNRVWAMPPYGYYDGGARINTTIIDRSQENSHQQATGNETWPGDKVFVRPPVGYYNGNTWVYVSEPDLVPNNIVNGVEVLGVTGTRRPWSGEVRAASGTATATASSGYSKISVRGLSFNPIFIIADCSPSSGSPVADSTIFYSIGAYCNYYNEYGSSRTRTYSSGSGYNQFQLVPGGFDMIVYRNSVSLDPFIVWWRASESY